MHIINIADIHGNYQYNIISVEIFIYELITLFVLLYHY